MLVFHTYIFEYVKNAGVITHDKMFYVFISRFMLVLICLIFSVLSTIEEYAGFANETLFYMVSTLLVCKNALSLNVLSVFCTLLYDRENYWYKLPILKRSDKR